MFYVVIITFLLFLAMMSVCVPPPCNSSSSVDVANHNGPPATPPTSLSLRSSHNQLLSGDVIKQGQATPPKCRKKYALTSIQTAMGLGEGGTPQSSSSANPKLAKNGANQLRKAAEQQDHNKNPTKEDEDEDGNTSLDSEVNIDDDLSVEKLSLDSESNTDVDHSDFDPNNELNEDVSELINDDTNEEDLVQSVENCDDLLILSEKNEIVSDRKSSENLKTKSYLESCLDALSFDLPSVQDDVTKPLLEEEKNLTSPTKQQSPEDTPLLSVGSSSSSSSPETKKDRPRTGAKTDRALNRIQNLPHSDEESSWTTLSQDSASIGSPEESGKYTCVIVRMCGCDLRFCVCDLDRCSGYGAHMRYVWFGSGVFVCLGFSSPECDR